MMVGMNKPTLWDRVRPLAALAAVAAVLYVLGQLVTAAGIYR